MCLQQDSYQTARMCRHVWVFALHTCQFVDFAVPRHISLKRATFNKIVCVIMYEIRGLVVKKEKEMDTSSCLCTPSPLVIPGSQPTTEHCHHQERSYTGKPESRNEVASKQKEPQHDKIIKMTCAPSEDSYQPGHSSSLIRVFAVRTKTHWVLDYPYSTQLRPAQADISLRLVHSTFGWFCRAAGH